MKELLEERFGVILVFCFVIGVMVWSVMRMSKQGWSVLAERFKAGIKPEGAKISQVTGTINGRKIYKKVLIVFVSEEGLYLKTGFPFFWNHPPLFIKWSEMTHYKENRVGDIGFNLQASVQYCDKRLDLELPIKLSEDFKQKAGIKLST